MAKPWRRKDSKYWWISPWVAGKQVPQSTHTTDYALAEKKLKILEGRIADGVPLTAKTDRGSFAELLELVRTDYKIKRRRSLYDLEKRLDLHLIPFFGHYPAGKITSLAINDFILFRQSRKAAAATINRELSVIGRAFTLGIRSGLVSQKPYIEHLPEDNTRTGYYSTDQIKALMAKATPLLADILLFAFTTGWRIESVMRLEWVNVDIGAGVVTLRANQTKNRMPTVFPLDCFPDTLAMLKRRSDERLRSPFVFHRDGEPVKSIRKTWENIRSTGNLLHDLRRTAVRNLKALGFSDTEVMKMVGLRTLSMFHRYNITTEADIVTKSKAIAALRSS